MGTLSKNRSLVSGKYSDKPEISSEAVFRSFRPRTTSQRLGWSTEREACGAMAISCILHASDSWKVLRKLRKRDSSDFPCIKFPVFRSRQPKCNLGGCANICIATIAPESPDYSQDVLPSPSSEQHGVKTVDCQPYKLIGATQSFVFRRIYIFRGRAKTRPRSRVTVHDATALQHAFL